MKKRVISLLLAVLIFGSFALEAIGPVHAASSFVTSDDGVGYIKSEEGFSKYPYWDYAQYTVGYGTRCPDDMLEEYQKNGITTKEAEELLRKHLTGVEKAINEDLIDKFKLTLTQNQFDALVSFSYNCGTGWMYENSNLRRVIVEGADENEIVNRLAQWCKAGGQVKTFLLRRRLCEANMYLYGVYSKTAPDYLGYVMYDAAGGTSPFVVQGYSTEIKSAIIPTPTYDGYTFQGWYTLPVGGTKVTELDLSVRNTRLYAHWLDAEGKDPALDNIIDPVEVKVESDGVNLRPSPSTSGDSLGKANKGDTFVITAIFVAEGYTWGQYDGGWICLDYTNYESVKPKDEETPEQTPEPEPEPEPEPLPEFCEGTVNVKTTLNIRTGAGTNYALNGSLKNKATVKITETKTVSGTVWGKIGEQKWISLDYVTVTHYYANDCDTSCDVCKAERTITHTYKSVTTKATLTRHGKVEKTCTVCGNVTSTTIRYPKTIKLSATSYTYNGKVKTPTVTVKDSTGKALKKDTDYTVTYSSGRKNVGTYKVTIKFKGNYSGTKTLTFKINPKAASIKNLTAKSKGLYVRINRQTTQSTGYEIQCSTTKTFKSVKTVTTGYKTVKKAINGLKAKTTYYVRLRTYKTVDGTKYYSSWSAVKNIKTK